MRVVAGTLGGRVFDSPGTAKTHPMSDKARGALFNILGDIDGLEFLDAFAGSGALAFEAVSRGASKVTAIEQDGVAQKAISRNIVVLGVDGQVHLVKASAAAWLQTANMMFDIVLCDPPYTDLQPGLVQQLTSRVQPGGLLVLSLPSNAAKRVYDGFEQVSQRTYGDMQLIFYRRTSTVD